jgi:hypothetical protein
MVTECCISGFQWDGTPTGKEGRIADHDAYVVGENGKVAILVIAGMLVCDYRSHTITPSVDIPALHPFQPFNSKRMFPLIPPADLFGWTFTNTRLLCDAYAAETPATVYMPDLSVLLAPFHLFSLTFATGSAARSLIPQ